LIALAQAKVRLHGIELVLESTGKEPEEEMIPLRDENPSPTVPYVVYALILLNVLVYLVDYLGTHLVQVSGTVGGQVLQGKQIMVSGLWNYSMIPYQIVSHNPNLPAVIKGIQVPHLSPSPVWITIFTSMFLHGGLIHLGLNMLFLWIFGNNIEDALGHVKFFLFYMTGGIVAAAAHILSDTSSTIPTLGASGAIAAVLGAYLILYPKNRIDCLVFFGYFITTAAIPAIIVLGLWVLLQFVNASLGGGMTQGGGVAYWAHIGGFVAGVIGILVLTGGKPPVRRPKYYSDWDKN
jgi:membrane associated rhomboid family serine protease